jgi:hypothetical protein
MFLHDWKEDGLIGMVSDFDDLYITKEEYLAETCPHRNESGWLKSKAAMDASLISDRYKGVTILLASYSYEDYQGDAFVLFERDGKLFEVNGNHCSCYGLEDQWEPEETTKDALMHRLEKGAMGADYCGNIFADELRAVLVSI